MLDMISPRGGGGGSGADVEGDNDEESEGKIPWASKRCAISLLPPVDCEAWSDKALRTDVRVGTVVASTGVDAETVEY
jgi:hypothetical protein